MIRPEEYFLSPASVQLFGSPPPQPAPRKSSWHSTLKKDLGKIKEHTLSYVRGSMDSLLSRLSSCESTKNNISEFLYAPNGLILEVLPREVSKRSSSTERRSKKGRNSRPLSHSPLHKSSTPLFKTRNHSIPMEGPGDVSYETLQQHLSRLDDIISRHRQASLENSQNTRCSSIAPPLDQQNFQSCRRVSHSNVQLPEDFSKCCPDRSFDCPLQGVCIYDGRFRACLPLSSFPQGHVCLKVRGYRLEIAQLINNIDPFENRNFFLKAASEASRNEVQKMSSFNYDNSKLECLRGSFSSTKNSFQFQTRNSSQLEMLPLVALKSEKQKRNANNDEGLMGYKYLGSVSVPIFVEPSTLEFSIDGDMRWLKIHGMTKGCISSSCLNLEDQMTKD